MNSTIATASDIVKNIINALNEDDYDTVEDLARNIITTPIEEFAKTMLQLLLVCDDDERFPYMVDVLSVNNPYTQLHVINIVTTWTFNREIVEYAKKYLPELTHLEMIDQWITYPGAYFDNIGIACNIYMSVYGPISDSVMKTMLEDAINANKYDFYNALFSLYSSTSSYAPIPNWIDDRMTTDEELSSKQLLLGKNKLDDTDLSKQLYDKLHMYIGESKTDILNILHGLDDDSKETLTTLLLSDEGDDEHNHHIHDGNITSYFGPSNPFPTYMHDPIQERMFLCNVYIPDVDVEDEPVEQMSQYDWFTGSCDECGQRIRSYHHCLRLPMLTGGWMGCFCSWKCIQDREDSFETNGDEEDPLKVTIQDLIVKIKDEIEKKRIYDR